LLQHGILLAIHYQRLLVQTAMTILEKKMVKSLKNFQLVILKSRSDEGEAKIFGSSIPMLYRLTSFLVEAYQVYPNAMAQKLNWARSIVTAAFHLCVLPTTNPPVPTWSWAELYIHLVKSKH